VHCQHAGHPILMDKKYCEQADNAWAKSLGLTRMFLHAHEISFTDHDSETLSLFSAPLEPSLQSFLDRLSDAE